MAAEPQNPPSLVFDRFRLVPSLHLLLKNEKPCRLGARAVEILAALVERAGETVTKQDLLERAWPGALVDEANLRVHIAALRRVLGDGEADARHIVNVMGRGYCFVAPVTRDNRTVTRVVPRTESSRRHNLPASLTRLIGRTEIVETITLQVPMRRCVTITGPGGIGKTTVAIAVAERLHSIYDDGVWFVDLSAVTNHERIPLVMASVLGFSASLSTPVASLLGFLQRKRLLLVLDNCEHLIESVASLAEAILRHSEHVNILATSREALRADGEWVHLLKPIEAPPAGSSLTAAQAVQFPSVELFVERASENLDDFHLTDADAPVVAEVCRRLDGLPLAIELAAARVDLFGLRGLQAILTEQLIALTAGPRTAQPRQQSLIGAIDWSYGLLWPVEQTILRRLAVFRGKFTLEAAVAVAASEAVRAEHVYAGLLTLVSKSLIASDVMGATPQPRYHLLHVTRSFVDRKLRDSGERAHVLRRHAEYFCHLLVRAEENWESTERALWLAIYGPTIEDVRSALDWAFSREGDAAIGVTLAAHALALGFQLSLIDELRTWAERALIHANLVTPPQPLAEMRLNIALASLTQNMMAPVPGRALGFERAIELSQHLEPPARQAEPLIAQAAHRLGAADYAIAAELATKATEIAAASGDPKALIGAKRIAAQVHHFNGDHATARQLATEVLEYPMIRMPLRYNPMPVDRRVSMRIILARIAWMEGFPDTAATLARESINLAVTDSAFSLCQALVLAGIPIAMWRGDDASAEAMNGTLDEQGRRYGLGYWQSWVPAFRAVLEIRGGSSSALPTLSSTLQLDTFATLHPECIAPATIIRANTDSAGWCQPEIHRAQGEWLLAEGAPGANELAEGLFQHSLEVARRHGACSWELRSATSLARLWQRLGRSAEARALLSAIYQNFNEGHGTADWLSAKTTLEALSPRIPIVKSKARRRRTDLHRR